jgi:hypothetical protein
MPGSNGRPEGCPQTGNRRLTLAANRKRGSGQPVYETASTAARKMGSIDEVRTCAWLRNATMVRSASGSCRTMLPQ